MLTAVCLLFICGIIEAKILVDIIRGYQRHLLSLEKILYYQKSVFSGTPNVHNAGSFELVQCVVSIGYPL